MNNTERKELNIYYRDEMQKILDIIHNSEIEDKILEIEKMGILSKFEKSLDYKFYSDFNEQLKELNEWYQPYRKVKTKKQTTNQYSQETIDKKIKELLYLNELYEKKELNETTFYEVFKNMNVGAYGFEQDFKYLHKSKKIDFEDEKIKQLFKNLPEISKKCRELLSGVHLENLKYRKSVETILDNNKYIENYNYAEFIIKKYIEEEQSYSMVWFLKKYNIDDTTFNYCVGLIEFINPILYREFLKASKENNKKRTYNNIQTFKELYHDIKEYKNNGSEYPVEEFLKKTPFKNYQQYLDKVISLLGTMYISKEIISYIYRHKIKELKFVRLEEELKITRIVDGRTLTKEDTKNLFKIMDANGYPHATKVYKIVMNRYINGKYDMDEINRKYELLKDNNEEIINNPYSYIPVKKIGGK